MPKYPSKKGLTEKQFKAAVREYNKEWRKTPRAKALQEAKKPAKRVISFTAHLKRHYKMSPKDYENMLELQEGRCAICGAHKDELKRILQVDHCHVTSKIRELLCNSCNGGLGPFRDSPETLQKAIDYLTKHKEKWNQKNQ